MVTSGKRRLFFVIGKRSTRQTSWKQIYDVDSAPVQYTEA
jgi:hypothetical protein